VSFRTPQIIIPRLPGQYVNGKWGGGADGGPVTTLASVQPARSGDDDQLHGRLR